ncbi:GDP-mannose 4,6-dehydratase [Methanolacinia petrolearia DSM 11571]|uniref:GDP-mannose 4,6-dehydratase n=1 Tax=Methanolacinia petrolearia (strain DSM 11571 / OCM 486 / SEBR 4847) TaxID=679926 RepID=E1RFD6_METP4|nr:GDP-mannose 4,6-dehydratase [Methanolacinia petrolearia]ADN36166.1 GDP-mannose 4,6-dehydratase [Methanolacinia petrolearia DSM 11571]
MEPKKALITGITGQDGSYLAELLLSRGYEVHGLIRRASTFNTSRIDHILGSDGYVEPHDSSIKLYLHYGDLSDAEQINNIIYNVKPDEVYHLGAQSHVRVSFDIPEYTGNVTALGTTRILEAIRRSGLDIRFYQASSSEMFGGAEPPQDEETCFVPRSPYACAKLYSYWMAKNYREGYDMFASNGILFNHESPRRGETFVTRKITRGIAAILAKKAKYLYLGNLDAKRDWGFSPEYVEAMWMMLQAEKSDDFVIGTGETHSINEFLDEAFSYVGLNIDDHVRIDQKYFRPTEVDALRADPTKAEKDLGWKAKVTFKDLVKIMLDADLRAAGVEVPGEGDEIIQKKFETKWWKGD